MAKVGRPTKYKPEMCDLLEGFGREGMSLCEMAAELGICWDTFCEWQKEKPEFSDAVNKARRFSQAWWEKNGRIATFGGHEGFNATSYIFQMKNRFPDDWRDKRENDHNHKGLTITLESDSEDL